MYSPLPFYRSFLCPVCTGPLPFYWSFLCPVCTLLYLSTDPFSVQYVLSFTFLPILSLSSMYSSFTFLLILSLFSMYSPFTFLLILSLSSMYSPFTFLPILSLSSMYSSFTFLLNLSLSSVYSPFTFLLILCLLPSLCFSSSIPVCLFQLWGPRFSGPISPVHFFSVSSARPGPACASLDVSAPRGLLEDVNCWQCNTVKSEVTELN